MATTLFIRCMGPPLRGDDLCFVSDVSFCTLSRYHHQVQYRVTRNLLPPVQARPPSESTTFIGLSFIQHFLVPNLPQKTNIAIKINYGAKKCRYIVNLRGGHFRFGEKIMKIAIFIVLNIYRGGNDNLFSTFQQKRLSDFSSDFLSQIRRRTRTLSRAVFGRRFRLLPFELRARRRRTL